MSDRMILADISDAFATFSTGLDADTVVAVPSRVRMPSDSPGRPGWREAL
jgi:hypothetical protein